MSRLASDNSTLEAWLEESYALLKPDKVIHLTGAEDELPSLCSELYRSGEFVRLNEKLYPNSYWYCSDPDDVARVEERTYICSPTKNEAGPLNNWMSPKEALTVLNPILDGSMKSRTLYVIPYLMGPVGSAFSKVGFELTDSAYVAASMSLMTRVGDVALRQLEKNPSDFVKGIHSTCKMNPGERYICHFTKERSIISVNSNYGGNALLGKKCFALRIASCQAREEGWLAEHMLILGITCRKGVKHYIAAAFPSGCGKTNLAMLVPPKEYAEAGWKIETVGDDIAWLRVGSDGRLWAINPEAGFFGVAPGTNSKTNPNAMGTISRNTIFTNTAIDLSTMTPWWEGLSDSPPERVIDWRKFPWTPAKGTPAAHPNARFTVSASQCPTIDPEWESPNGVPISAIVFGGRRAKAAPLVYEAFDWNHGTFVGASMCSETTAAAVGNTGELRRDPMAMRPFIGYHLGDYLSHWFSFGKGNLRLPKIFHVNWFRKDDNGNYLWPGYGDNLRVLEWIVGRVEGHRAAKHSPLGLLPDATEMNFEGLNLSLKTIADLFRLDPGAWIGDIESQEEFFTQIGTRLPPEIWAEHEALKSRLSQSR